MNTNRCNSHGFRVFLSTWNAIQNHTTPKLHFRIATWLEKSWARGDPRLLLQAFRASGKSTLIGVFCAWVLCRDPDLRILVLSAESSLAEKMVRTIRKVIEKHPFTTHLQPKNPDQWAADSFTVRRKRVSRDPSVLARGVFANLTGTRADVIICDDVEVPNTSDTAEKRLRLRERLSENDFIKVPGGRQIYIGTPHAYHSLYVTDARRDAAEIFLKDYKELSIPLLDEKGGSAWPERYDAAHIDDLRRTTGPLKFASQMMLQPVNIVDCRLDPALLQRYEDELYHREAQRTSILSLGQKRLLSASAWWDPAFGKASGDKSVLAVVFTDDSGGLWLHRMIYISVVADAKEDEATQQCRIVAQAAKELYLPMVAVETNGLGKFLPAILRRELALADVNCSVIEKHSTQNKVLRILEAFDAPLAAKAINVHASVFQTPFPDEMREWRPGGKGHDDGLDAAAGAILSTPLRLKKYYATQSKSWSGSGGFHAAVTDFEV